jgi:hypothetical protein
MKKTLVRRPFILTLLGVALVAGAVALGQGVTQTGRIQYSPTAASNPFPAGKAGTYFNSVDQTEHSVNVAGVDKTTVDSLQTAYGNSPNVQATAALGTINVTVPNLDMAPPALTATHGACLADDTVPFNGLNQDMGARPECNGIAINNPTSAGSNLYSSPELQLSAKIWDSTLGAVDQRRFNIALQDTEGAGDTMHVNFYHYRHGKWFLPLSLVAQEDFGSTCPGAGCGETIFTTPNKSMFLYPGGVLSQTASLGINDNVIKMRSSPGSQCILTLGATGQTFSGDGKCGFGSIANRTMRMAVLGWDLNGNTDYGLTADGTGGPSNHSGDDSQGIRLVTDDGATNGNQYRSPSVEWHGDGWNPSVASHEGVFVYAQNVPVQQTVDAPYNTLSFTGTIIGRVSNYVIATLEQRSLGVVPGSAALGAVNTDMVRLGSATTVIGNRPSCVAAEEGLMYYVKGDGAGTRGTLYMCMESDSNTFNWINVKDGGP